MSAAFVFVGLADCLIPCLIADLTVRVIKYPHRTYTHTQAPSQATDTATACSTSGTGARVESGGVSGNHATLQVNDLGVFNTRVGTIVLSSEIFFLK